MKIQRILLICLLPLVIAATDKGCENTSQTEGRQLEKNHERLIREVPLPELKTSQERLNLVKRHQRINNTSNLVGKITLFQEGKPIASFLTKGKPTSLNAYLTGQDQITNFSGGPVTTEAPDHDGTYGQNREGIFFFTLQEDAYIEWSGDYVWVDNVNLPLNTTASTPSVEQVR